MGNKNNESSEPKNESSENKNKDNESSEPKNDKDNEPTEPKNDKDNENNENNEPKDNENNEPTKKPNKKSALNKVFKFFANMKFPRILPSLPIPIVLLAKASMTATAMFDLVNNTFNDHKEDIAEFLKAKLELLKNRMVEANLVVQEQTMKTLQDIKKIKVKGVTMADHLESVNDKVSAMAKHVKDKMEEKIQSQTGGSTFSQEECTFF